MSWCILAFTLLCTCLLASSKRSLKSWHIRKSIVPCCPFDCVLGDFPDKPHPELWKRKWPEDLVKKFVVAHSVVHQYKEEYFLLSGGLVVQTVRDHSLRSSCSHMESETFCSTSCELVTTCPSIKLLIQSIHFGYFLWHFSCLPCSKCVVLCVTSDNVSWVHNYTCFILLCPWQLLHAIISLATYIQARVLRLKFFDLAR